MKKVTTLLIDEDGIKPYHYVDDFADEAFVSVFNLLESEMATAASLASAIEAKDEFIFTYDRYNRFIKATEDSEEKSIGSKAFILDELARYVALETGNLEGSKKGQEDYNRYIDDPNCPLYNYGWLKEDLPKFDLIYKAWLNENSNGKYAEKDITHKPLPAQQHEIWRLCDLLLRDKYKDKYINEVRNPKKKNIADFAAWLETDLGFSIGTKTLRDYVKLMSDKI